MNVKLIGKHEKDSRACRDGLALTLNELMAEDKSIVYVDCDLMGCINTKMLMKNYPDRAFEAGIAEGNAAGVAAGLAATGKKVFFHSFGTFSSRRCYDQIYMSAAYAGLSVRVLGSDAGVTAAFNGGTHMPLEDAAMYLSIPETTVLDPADYGCVYVCGLEVEEKTGDVVVDFLERSGLPVFFAPGPRLRRIDPGLMERVFALRPVLHLNDDEAEEYTGTDTLEDAAGGLGEADQDALEQAVVQLHVPASDIPEAAHGKGVGHHAEDEIVLHLVPLPTDLHGKGAYRGQALHALQQIRHMAQHVLHLLPGLVGHVREQAESGDVYEHVVHIVISEGADVAGKVTAPHRYLGGPHHVLGQGDAASEVICAPRGDIADGRAQAALDHSRHYLVQGAVAAAAYYQFVILPAARHHSPCVIPLLCGRYRDLIPLLGEDIQYISQPVPDLGLAGFGIVYKKQLSLHRTSPLFPAGEKSRDSVQRGLLVSPLRGNLQVFAQVHSQRHHAHDALGIHPLVAGPDVDGAFVLAGLLHQHGDMPCHLLPLQIDADMLLFHEFVLLARFGTHVLVPLSLCYL